MTSAAASSLRIALAALAAVFALAVAPSAAAVERGEAEDEAARLQGLVRGALLDAVPFPRGRVRVRSLRVPRVRKSARFTTATVELRARERYRGLTTFAVVLEGRGAESERVWATAELRVRRPVVVAARDLRAGRVLQKGDLEEVIRELGADLGDGVGRVDEAVGRVLKRSLRAFASVRSSDLAKQRAVRRGGTVTLIVRVGGLEATVRGQALGDGAIGDSLSVLNLGSGKKVQGRVEARGRVVVEL